MIKKMVVRNFGGKSKLFLRKGQIGEIFRGVRKLFRK